MAEGVIIPSPKPKQLISSLEVIISGFSPAKTSAVSNPVEQPLSSVTKTV